MPPSDSSVFDGRTPRSVARHCGVFYVQTWNGRKDGKGQRRGEYRLSAPARRWHQRRAGTCHPLLANIYLHYVFDLWAKRWRGREATGDMIIVRYADDLIVGFQHEAEARCFLEIMRGRLKEFSLSLHPDKTRLIEFGRFAAANRERRGLGKPETFNFLGFTFISGKSRRGHFLICTQEASASGTLRRTPRGGN